ncbi:MAG: hypothetical protein Kow0069_35960 [Promethearchaeota archaeon]
MESWPPADGPWATTKEELQLKDMNTAVFFDVENLTKGYGSSNPFLEAVSLKEVLEAVLGTGIAGGIAVQVAYADWANHRLRGLRREALKLGMVPIQVLDAHKNCADMQIAVDALALAFERPHLDVFIIVSGDGGFAPLVNKLHELGKKVVGCAYSESASSTFRAVCDVFVELEQPAEETPAQRAHGAPDVHGINDPRVVEMSKEVDRAPVGCLADVVEKARQVLAWFARRHLDVDGLHLSVVREALAYAVDGFSFKQLGFGKFVEFLQYTCAGTRFCVVRRGSNTLVLPRGALSPEDEILPDLNDDYLHSQDCYFTLLRRGPAVIVLPPSGVLDATAAFLFEVAPCSVPLLALAEECASVLNCEVSAVKTALLAIATAGGLLLEEPPGGSGGGQLASIAEGVSSAEELVDALKSAAKAKLMRTLGKVDEKIFESLFDSAPDLAGRPG